MVLTVFARIAEFERELIQERTRSGRVAAQARRAFRPATEADRRSNRTRTAAGE
jgi:DNA invertase Pin-like site-specific DNA recombinase